jgi:hypothetical protein
MILYRGSLPTKDKETISLAVDNGLFPWFWAEEAIKKNTNYVQVGAFFHLFFDHSPLEIKSPKYFYLAEIIIKELLTNEEIKNKFKFEKIVRARANLTCSVKSVEEDTIHIDTDDEDCFSIIYYVIDSDGDTLLFNDQKDIINRESPQAGNYIIFKSNQLHGFQTPKNHKKRIVFNIVLSGKVVNK